MASAAADWTDRELGQLLITRDQPAREVAQLLGRTHRAVGMKRSQLNRSPELLARAQAASPETELAELLGVWRGVVGYEGLYEVSDLGEVRSVDRTVPCTRNGTRTVRGRVLSQKSDHGYRAVTLSKGNVPATRRVHLLVLEAFQGACPPGLEACHNDGQASRNELTNLRWDTSASNARDTVDHGHHPATARTHCPQRHPLVAPNLRRGAAAAGHRGCLACMRAQGLIARRREAGRPVEDLQTLSDWYFTRIMAAA